MTFVLIPDRKSDGLLNLPVQKERARLYVCVQYDLGLEERGFEMCHLSGYQFHERGRKEETNEGIIYTPLNGVVMSPPPPPPL